MVRPRPASPDGASGRIECGPGRTEPRPCHADAAWALEPSIAAFQTASWWRGTRHETATAECIGRPSTRRDSRAGPRKAADHPTRDAYEADVHAVEGTPNGNGFVVGWYEKAADKACWCPASAVVAQRHRALDQDASPPRPQPVARVHGELVFAAWVEDETPPAAACGLAVEPARGNSSPARRVADAGHTT